MLFEFIFHQNFTQFKFVSICYDDDDDEKKSNEIIEKHNNDRMIYP